MVSIFCFSGAMLSGGYRSPVSVNSAAIRGAAAEMSSVADESNRSNLSSFSSTPSSLLKSAACCRWSMTGEKAVLIR